MLLDYHSTKHATVQAACIMLVFKIIQLLNKTKNLSHQEKEKKYTNFKIKSKMRTDKKMSIKISDIKVGDKILSRNENETNLQPYINLNYLQRLIKRKHG